MLKVKIVLDEEKINSDAVYYPEEIRRVIDEAFFEQGIVKEGEHFYVGTGSNQDFGGLWAVNGALAKKAWFIKYVKEWLWYNSDDGKDENDFSIENIIEGFRKHRIGAFAYEQKAQ